MPRAYSAAEYERNLTRSVSVARVLHAAVASARHSLGVAEGGGYVVTLDRHEPEAEAFVEEYLAGRCVRLNGRDFFCATIPAVTLLRLRFSG